MANEREELDKLGKELKALREEFTAHKAGTAAALATISATLRELPEFDAPMFKSMLTATLQGWPLAGLPDNEANEVAYAAPLRFLIQEHERTRAQFRTKKK